MKYKWRHDQILNNFLQPVPRLWQSSSVSLTNQFVKFIKSHLCERWKQADRLHRYSLNPRHNVRSSSFTSSDVKTCSPGGATPCSWSWDLRPMITARPKSHRAAAWISGRWLSRTWASPRGSGWGSSAPSGGPGGERSTADPGDAAERTASSEHPPWAPAASQPPAGPSRRAGLQGNQRIIEINLRNPP